MAHGMRSVACDRGLRSVMRDGDRSFDRRRDALALARFRQRVPDDGGDHQRAADHGAIAGIFLQRRPDPDPDRRQDGFQQAEQDRLAGRDQPRAGGEQDEADPELARAEQEQQA